MILKEEFINKGFFVLQALNADTGELISETPILENTLTNINREYRQAMLDGTFLAKNFTIDALQIKAFALGDGTTASTENDTRLENEIFRRPITSISTSGNDTISVLSLLPSQANFRIREIGVFAGPTSTTMISRINVDYTKNANIRLNIIRIDRTVI